MLSIKIIILIIISRCNITFGGYSENGPASITNYPYVVSIQTRHTLTIYNITRMYMHLCEGVIIDKRWVITPAHCIAHHGQIIPFDQIRVVAGDTHLQCGKHYQYSMRNLANFYFPKEFNNSQVTESFPYDVVLLELLGSIPSVFFKTLPPYTGNGNDLNSSICVTPYWGYQLNIMMFYNNLFSPHSVRQSLRASDVIREKCPQRDNPSINEASICFKRLISEPWNRCTSNSGAPLVCDNKLVGILIEDNKCKNMSDRYLRYKNFLAMARQHFDRR